MATMTIKKMSIINTLFAIFLGFCSYLVYSMFTSEISGEEMAEQIAKCEEMNLGYVVHSNGLTERPDAIFCIPKGDE